MCKRSIYIVLFLLGILLYSCNRGKQQEDDNHVEVDTEDPIAEVELLEFGPIWNYDQSIDSLVRIDSSQSLYPISYLIDVINKKYAGKIKLDSTGQVGDSLFVKIDSADYLTQQMGSAGARAYMAEATYTLTEADSIAFVVFDFVEGDHAVPGVYARRSFAKKNLMIDVE